METPGNDQVLTHATIEGRVRFRREPGEEQKCVCCPEGTGHVFSRAVDFGVFDSGLPEHFGYSAKEFVYSVALRGRQYEGKRVRLTVEILED